MKNNAIIFTIGAIFLAMILGCGRIIPSSKGTGSNSKTSSEDNKTLTDKGLDVALGDEKTGVPECDDAIEYLDQLIDEDNPDEGIAAKAIKRTILNGFKSQFKQAIDENKSDKVQLAKTCKDFKNNLMKFKAEDDAKKAENSK